MSTKPPLSPANPPDALYTCFFCKWKGRATKLWSPDGARLIRRQHCGLKCYRRYKLLYQSDATLRLKHTLANVRERLLGDTSPEKRAELLKREGELLQGIANAHSRGYKPSQKAQKG